MRRIPWKGTGEVSGVRLGLVTKALLVAIRLHALLPLVLADLGLTTLLEATHGGYLVSGFERGRRDLPERFFLRDDLVEGILDDALGPELLQVGDEVAGHRFLDDDFNSHPATIRERADRRTAQGR